MHMHECKLKHGCFNSGDSNDTLWAECSLGWSRLPQGLLVTNSILDRTASVSAWCFSVQNFGWIYCTMVKHLAHLLLDVSALLRPYTGPIQYSIESNMYMYILTYTLNWVHYKMQVVIAIVSPVHLDGDCQSWLYVYVCAGNILFYLCKFAHRFAGCSRHCSHTRSFQECWSSREGSHHYCYYIRWYLMSNMKNKSQIYGYQLKCTKKKNIIVFYIDVMALSSYELYAKILLFWAYHHIRVWKSWAASRFHRSRRSYRRCWCKSGHTLHCLLHTHWYLKAI